MSPATPIGETMTVREARNVYLAENGFRLLDYKARFVEIPMGPITIQFPNTRARQRVVPFHDLHHVLTGYGTDWVGEAEIGAWELRAGCTTFIAWLLNGGAFLIGLVLAPRRTLRALRQARRHTTLYKIDVPYDDLLDMQVGDARALLGIDRAGQADHPRRLHARAPAQLGS